LSGKTPQLIKKNKKLIIIISFIAFVPGHSIFVEPGDDKRSSLLAQAFSDKGKLVLLNLLQGPML
jgi:hypothetical protein